ncbi:MAG: glycosyltransferase [Alphaproteobacteria bacterium]|uniref:Glycosyltransferase n=1 Tax=Candidatus Nitrobium versatile TaxID=2884831 RepID=A0A953J2M4_9BACT|nr:glycosyltransferase [Candidatus Nitrobium versatile]
MKCTTGKYLPVSVVIPTYNRAGLIRRAVDSVLVSVEDEDEVIVVDDGSSDNTEEVLFPYRNRIRYIRTGNAGAGAARNRGVREARNPLVAFLDSDDEWMPHKLQVQRAVMQARPDVLFCFSDFAVRYLTGETVRRYLINWHSDTRSWTEILGPAIPFSLLSPLPCGGDNFPVHIGNMYLQEMKANYISTITLMARRTEAGDALRFSEDTDIYEDWECIGRLAGAGKAAYLDCETAWNHGHRGKRLTDADTLRCTGARIRMLERLWGTNTEFLSRHGELYREVLAAQYLLHAKELIVRGMTPEARRDLRCIGEVPFPYLFLASLPGPLAQWLYAVRKETKSLIARVRTEKGGKGK